MENNAPHTVSAREGLEVFRTMRVKLIERGLKCPLAETYAKDTFTKYRALVLTGQRPKALELLSNKAADTIVALHWEGVRISGMVAAE